ncbi:hypothetical protein BHM03_00021759 [Ensete ventricosum]|nr:hypothetical protein BHM03_00021759 [Ensete ventricosum]
MGRRGVASFSHWKTRRHLAPPREDEAVSRPHAGRRGIDSLPRSARYRPVAGGPCTGILSDRYVSPVPGSVDRNGEPCF